jgi:hypothetical protein
MLLQYSIYQPNRSQFICRSRKMWGWSVILADAVSALLAPSNLNRQEHPADQSFNHSLLDAFIEQTLKLPLQICEMDVGSLAKNYSHRVNRAWQKIKRPSRLVWAILSCYFYITEHHSSGYCNRQAPLWELGRTKFCISGTLVCERRTQARIWKKRRQ